MHEITVLNKTRLFPIIKTFKGVRLFRKGVIIREENTDHLGQIQLFSTWIMTPATKSDTCH